MWVEKYNSSIEKYDSFVPIERWLGRMQATGRGWFRYKCVWVKINYLTKKAQSIDIVIAERDEFKASATLVGGSLENFLVTLVQKEFSDNLEI